MWTFKRLESVSEADITKGEGLGIKVSAVFGNEKTERTISTVLGSKEEMERTLRVVEQRLNQRDADLASIDVATYTLPAEEEVVEPVVEKTAEQTAAEQFEQEKATLIQMKADLDLGLITQAEYDTKLEDVKALKTPKEEIKK